MRVRVTGTADECAVVLAALNLTLDVRDASRPRPALLRRGRVCVHADVADPDAPGYGAGAPGSDEAAEAAR